MAFPVVLKTYVNKIRTMTNRFLKAHPLLVYSNEVSLEKIIAAMLEYDLSINTRNEMAIAYSNSIDAMNKSEAKLSKLESDFLTLTGVRFTRDSDEYVWAGGKRQSEAIEKRKLTLEENQRLEKVRLETEAAEAKAKKEQVEAEMAELRAEVERLKTERDRKI